MILWLLIAGRWSFFISFFLIYFTGSESVEEDVLQMFFKDREVNGDFISKASDMLWQREVLKVVDPDAGQSADIGQQAEQVP